MHGFVIFLICSDTIAKKVEQMDHNEAVIKGMVLLNFSGFSKSHCCYTFIFWR